MNLFVNPQIEPVFKNMDLEPIDPVTFEPQDATPARCSVLAELCYQYGFDPRVCVPACCSTDDIDQAHLIAAAICGRHRAYLFHAATFHYQNVIWYDSDPTIVAIAQHFRANVKQRQERDRLYTAAEIENESLKRENKQLLEENTNLLQALGAVSARPAAQKSGDPYYDARFDADPDKETPEEYNARRLKNQTENNEAIFISHAKAYRRFILDANELVPYARHIYLSKDEVEAVDTFTHDLLVRNKITSADAGSYPMAEAIHAGMDPDLRPSTSCIHTKLKKMVARFEQENAKKLK